MSKKPFCCWLPGLPIVKKLPKGVSPALVKLVRLTPEQRAKAAIHLHHNPNVGWHECNATLLPAKAPLPFEVSVGGGSWMANHRVEFTYGLYADGKPRVPHRRIMLWKKNGGQSVSRQKAVKMLAALRAGMKLPRVEGFGGLWNPPEDHRVILGVALAECIARFDAMEPFATDEA